MSYSHQDIIIASSTDFYVQGDFNDQKSLHAAIKGSWGVFSVTNFWELFSAEAEEAQGKAVADVCKVSSTAAGISLGDSRLNAYGPV